MRQRSFPRENVYVLNFLETEIPYNPTVHCVGDRLSSETKLKLYSPRPRDSDLLCLLHLYIISCIIICCAAHEEKRRLWQIHACWETTSTCYFSEGGTQPHKLLTNATKDTRCRTCHRNLTTTIRVDLHKQSEWTYNLPIIANTQCGLTNCQYLLQCKMDLQTANTC